MALVSLAAGASSACDVDQRCWPSPDGRVQACVSDRVPVLDGPAQRLWIRGAGTRTQVAELAPDAEWCDEAIWEPAGRAVIFIVQRQRALIANAATGAVLRRIELVAGSGYPGSRLVRNVALVDGALTYDDCPRVDAGTCTARAVSLGPF